MPCLRRMPASSGDRQPPQRLNSAHGSRFHRQSGQRTPRKSRRASAAGCAARRNPPARTGAAGRRSRDDAGDDDDDARLPEIPEETRRPSAEGTLAIGRAAIERAVRLAPTSPGVYRMINAGRRRALCRQGQEPEEARDLLCARRPRRCRPHRAHDRRDRDGGVRLDPHRDRGAAARSQPHQAAAAALQRAAARRQVVSLHPDHRRPLGAADLQASRRASPARATISARSPRPARSTAPSTRCSAPSCCAPAPIPSSRAARGPACSTRSSAAPAPAPARSTFPAMPSWCARRTTSCPAAASGEEGARRRDAEGVRASSNSSARRSTATGSRRCRRSRRSRASIRARVEEADVFAIHQEGGHSCVQVFFFRTGQNWGNRAYFPSADKSLDAGGGARLVPRAVLRRQAAAEAHPAVARDRGERAAGRGAVRSRPATRSRSRRPQRGEKKELVDHALPNAREALGRRLAETATQSRAAARAWPTTFGLPQPPRRIEVYDNSHIMGTNAVGAMIVAGPEGFVKNQYRKFNIRSKDSRPATTSA